MPHRKAARLREIAALMSARIDEVRGQKSASVSSQKAAFRLVADELPLTVWTSGPDGIPTYHNRHWHETFGQNADYAEICHPDDMDGVAKSWEACLRSGLPYKYIARFRLPDGTYRALMTHAHPFYADDGSIAYWVGSSTELPDAKTHHLRLIA